jgi:hypothetical protein
MAGSVKQAKKTKVKPTADASQGPAAVVEDFVRHSGMWNQKACPFKATIASGHRRVALLAGPNASGKSFLAECALSWGREWCGTRSMKVSIRERTGSGGGDMSGMRRAMMFGNEELHSTGAVSARVVRSAFSNLETWSKEGIKTILLLDEPEIGLSEGFCYGMGELIGQAVRSMHEGACGVIVVSHSRALAKGLQEALGERPSFISMGEAMSFDQWVETEARLSADALIALGEKDAAGFKGVRKLLDVLRKKAG